MQKFKNKNGIRVAFINNGKTIYTKRQWTNILKYSKETT